MSTLGLILVAIGAGLIYSVVRGHDHPVQTLGDRIQGKK